jgi:hypothetical protein
MGPRASTWTSALTLAVATLLTFIARALIDFGFVYRELYPTTGSMGVLTLVYVLFLSGWIMALPFAWSGSRRAMSALLAYEAIVVFHAAGTQVVFCPFPCQTGWPLAQIVIFANLLVGIPAALTAFVSLTRKSAVSQ